MKKLQKGFTLIELMIVVAIIAILAAVAAPKFGDQLRKAKDAKAVQVVGSWRGGLNIQYADAGTYATTWGGIVPYVDAGTLGKTTTSSAVAATTPAGSPTQVAFALNGSSTDGSISFTTSENAVDGKAWTTK